MKRATILIVLVCAICATGCEEYLIHPEYKNTPEANFEAFWTEFDVAYGAMQAKHLNWDSLKTVYGNNINSSTTNLELYEAMCGLLNEINDGHASLYAPEFGRFQSWNRRDKSYYSDYDTHEMADVAVNRDTIKTAYLMNQIESLEVEGNTFFYGKIYEQNKTIGYICIPTFYVSIFPGSFIRAAVDTFQYLDAVIVDVRFNGGGTTGAFVYTLNTLAWESKVFMKSNYKNGPAQDDFTKLFDHTIRPKSTKLKNKAIAVLMNSFTASSSEHFVIGLKSQNGVITVGDTTCGAFSQVNERLLPNGWIYRLGGQVVYTPDDNLMLDVNGQYIEGHGIAPDYYVADQWASLGTGEDVVLNKAIEVLCSSLH